MCLLRPFRSTAPIAPASRRSSPKLTQDSGTVAFNGRRVHIYSILANHVGRMHISGKCRRTMCGRRCCIRSFNEYGVRCSGWLWRLRLDRLREYLVGHFPSGYHERARCGQNKPSGRRRRRVCNGRIFLCRLTLFGIVQIFRLILASRNRALPKVHGWDDERHNRRHREWSRLFLHAAKHLFSV